MQPSQNQTNQPIFNVPSIVLFLIVLFVSIHGFTEWFASADFKFSTILNLAFIPKLWSSEVIAAIGSEFPFWSLVSYSLLHSDWAHLGLNSLWMVVFGSVVARRVGIFRFILLCVLGSVGGAFAHYLSHIGSTNPMIGASAVVSACMGASTRFAFPRGRGFVSDSVNLPRYSLIETITNKQLLTFIVVWMALNFLFGSGLLDATGHGANIAWQAHVGGFIAGMLVFSVLDKRPR